MAIAPSLLWRGAATSTLTTVKTTDTGATTVITSIVICNTGGTSGWVTISAGGFYLAYQMQIAVGQTISMDLKTVCNSATAIQVQKDNIGAPFSHFDISISGVVSTGAADQAWLPYTPTLTASTTSPTNWTQTGYYTTFGKTVHCKFEITATASFTAGSGTYRIALPVAAKMTMNNWSGLGSAMCLDTSASAVTHPRISIDNTNYITLWYPSTWPSTGNAAVTNAAPYTWANGDKIVGALTYEAA